MKTILEARRAPWVRPRMIYRDCWRHFLDRGKKPERHPRDKLQYHTSVHFLNKPQPWKSKKDRLSCRCSSAARNWETRSPNAHHFLVAPRQIASAFLRWTYYRSWKKFLLSETSASATSFRHVVVVPRRPLIIDTARPRSQLRRRVFARNIRRWPVFRRRYGDGRDLGRIHGFNWILSYNRCDVRPNDLFHYFHVTCMTALLL